MYYKNLINGAIVVKVWKGHSVAQLSEVPRAANTIAEAPINLGDILKGRSMNKPKLQSVNCIHLYVKL